MQNFAFFLLFIPFFVAGNQCVSPNSEHWETWRIKDDNKLQIKRNTSTGIHGLRAEFSLPLTTKEFIEFLYQQNKITQWLDNAKTAKVVALTPNTNLVEIVFRGFLFVKPRRMVAVSTINHIADELTYIEVKNDDSLAPAKNVIDVSIINAFWCITKTSEKSIHVSYQALVDPKGDIPLWISNKFARKSIWNTIMNINDYFKQSQAL